uniref:Importin-11 n=1 Tax=Heterorhabditis bacteriophora TaxID=37862 RepID=A0A1I7WSD6_HETBA
MFFVLFFILCVIFYSLTQNAWSRAICAFCEAVRECETERPKEAAEEDTEDSPRYDHDNTDVSSRAIYVDQAEAIYEIIFQWMYSKDAKTRAEAAECVGELCLMVRSTKVIDDLKKLVTTILGLYKKAYSEQHTITLVLYIYMSFLIVMHKFNICCVSSIFRQLLWPYLFEFLCAERYIPVVGDICKCLCILVFREKEAGKQPDFETGFDNPRVAGRHAVLARLFVCLCNAPLNGLLARRAREAYNLMCCLSAWFHPAISDVLERWSERLEPLMDGEINIFYGKVYLTFMLVTDVCCTSIPSPVGDIPPAVELRGRRIARWHDACLEMLSACMTAVIDGDWRMELAASMGKQLDLYKDMADEKV